MLLIRLGWRESRRRPARAALTLASVVIGVAAVVAVALTTRSTEQAFDAMFAAIAGRADLEVAAPVGEMIDAKLLDAVRGIPGVAVASPMIRRPTIMYAGQRRTQVSLLGVEPRLDKWVHDFQVQSGAPLAERNGLLLSAEFAQNLGVSVGDAVALLTRSGRVRARITGLYKSRGTAVVSQGATLVTTLANAQRWSRAPGRLDAIQIVLAPEADEEAVEAAIAGRLTGAAVVRRPAGRSAVAEETALATDKALQMARAFSVLVAVFVITNTFLISVTQRRRQFGIMRAIGATRGQIARLVYGQAVMLGLAGTLLGSLAGVFAATHLSEAMGRLYNTALPPIDLSPGPFAWAAAIGLGISLLGAALPARKATHLPPLDAMRDVLPDEMEGFSGWLTWLGVALVAVCGSIMALSITGRLPPNFAVTPGVLMLAGLVLLLPLGLAPLSRAVARLLPASISVEARLASRNLLAHRSRTTLTVGVVFIAAAAAIGLANTVLDNVEDVRNWYRTTIVADYFLRASAPDMASGLAADLPDELGAELAEVEGVKSTDAIRFVRAEANGKQVILIIRGFDDPKLQAFDLVEGDPAEVRKLLEHGEVVLGSVFAERAGLKPGDDVYLKTESGQQRFRVAAVANDYLASGLTMYIDREVARRVLDVGGVDVYAIKADEGQREQVRQRLLQISEPYGVLLQSFSEIQREIDAMMAGVDAGLWAMVVLGLLVATFGVANTLTMSVLEQTYEIGLLRVIAMTQAQVRSMVMAQALMIGLLALAPGVVAGVGVGYLINQATLSTIGHSVDFVFHPWLLVGALVGGLAIMTAAAWPPANRAANMELQATLKLR